VDLTRPDEPGLQANGRPIKQGRIALRGAGPTGDAELDAALERLAKMDGKKAETAIPVAAKGARNALIQRLVKAGILAENKSKILGLFPTTKWPALQGEPEAELRSSVLSVLDDGAAPDQLTGCVIALLQGAQILSVVFPTKDKELRTAREVRAKELATSGGPTDWAIGATAAAVQTIMTAMAVSAAITATTAATTVVINS
ncbi:MAG: GPP34 family phosphoprotein, partial [Nakamurella sp.]